MRGGVFASFMSVAEPIASGRFETKIATSRLMLTPSPAASPIPSTSCSGMPSRNAPSASAVPPLAASSRRPGDIRSTTRASVK